MAFRTTDTGGIVITSNKGTAGMQLAGIGRDPELPATPAGIIRADGTRLEIARGSDTEWYVNSNTGIEQGMTLVRRPDGAGDLRVAFGLSGTLTPALEHQTLVFSDRNGSVIRYAGLRAYDATGRDLPAVMTLTGTRLAWQVDDRDAVYPVTIDPTWNQAQILTASDGANGNAFGYSVSLSNDTAVIGAVNAGKAYIFKKTSGTWSQQAILTASDGAGGDGFGNSVSLSNDTAVIGASSANSDKGKAYIFKNASGTWSQQAILTASDGAELDYFGNSVSLSNDTAVIGASYANSLKGKAYIFKNTSGTWSQQAILTASDGASGDTFGNSVSLSNDTAVIGASSANSLKGKAYIFKNTSGTWSQQAILTASDGASGDRFGYSVSLSNDTVVIGAASASSLKGKAYIFKNTSGTWSQQAILTASDGAELDYFGNSVSLSNGTAVIGASYANSLKGKAYIFKNTSGTWSQQAILTASDGAGGDGFGNSVSLSNDTVVIGAYGAASGRGKAYIFTPLPVPAVTGLSPAFGPLAGGTSVTITGTGFTEVSGVTFGSIPATSFTVNSDTSITATSPVAGSSGAGTCNRDKPCRDLSNVRCRPVLPLDRNRQYRR